MLKNNIFLLLVILIVTFIEVTLSSGGNNCYRRAQGRGVGIIPTSCAAGQERDGLLCYPYCDNGYSGLGPMCWSDCPADNYSDWGMMCMPSIKSGDNSDCPWYDKCGLTFDKGIQKKKKLNNNNTFFFSFLICGCDKFLFPLFHVILDLIQFFN